MNMQSIIEQLGVFKDHFFVVRLNSLGYRCGYVRPLLLETFNKIKEEYDNGQLNINCHGGITFVEYVSPEEKFLPPGHWIGFDCAHFFDLPDIDFATRVFELSPEEVQKLKEFTAIEGEQRTVQYVINNCFNIIEQLVLDYKDQKPV